MGENAATWKQRVLLVLLGLLLLVPGVFSLPLIDRDEPRFSRAAVEMMENGNPVVPYFNGEYRFDKPPLTYWAMWPGLKMLGVTEVAVRLPSLIAAICCALMIFSFGRRMGLRDGSAALAAAVWLSCLQVMIHGRLAVADMLLLSFLILTMRALWELGEIAGGWRAGIRSRWFHVLWIGMGLGFLAKGPLAWVVPLLALLIMWLMERWRKLDQRGHARGLLAMWALALLPALLIVALWGIPALLQTHGLFYKVGIGTHVVARGVEGFNKRVFIPGIYYLLVLPFFFAPWTAWLAQSFREAKSTGRNQVFLASWLLAPFAIFSFYATQLPHYILPGYPALCLLMAMALEKGMPGKLWLRWLLAGLPALVFSLAGIAMLWGQGPARNLDADFASLLLWLGLFLLCLAIACIVVALKRPWMAVLCMLLAAAAMQGASGNAARCHAVRRLIARTGEKLQTPAASGFSEPSMVWYGKKKWNFDPQLDPDAGLQVMLSRRWRLDGKSFATLWRGGSPVPVKDWRDKIPAEYAASAQTVSGWSTADSSWVELVYWQPRHD